MSHDDVLFPAPTPQPVSPASAPDGPAPTVGVLGLGAMGLPMAEHLLAAHGALTVSSRRPRPELTDQGAAWAATPRELAAASTAVLVMLPDLPELEPLLEGEDGLLFLDAGGCYYGGEFERIEATDESTVVFTLCKPDPAFLAKVAFEGFGIQSMEHIMETGGGPDILENPIGTGPYKLESWNRGESIVMTANPDYWGDAPIDETMVIRWATEGAARTLHNDLSKVRALGVEIRPIRLQAPS